MEKQMNYLDRNEFNFEPTPAFMIRARRVLSLFA